MFCLRPTGSLNKKMYTLQVLPAKPKICMGWKRRVCRVCFFFCRSRGGSSFSSQPVVTRGDGKANGVREYVSGELESGGLSLQKRRHVQKGRKRRPCT